MIRAKARWAVANGAVKPIVSTDDRLVLRNARHPLLQQTPGRRAGRWCRSICNSTNGGISW